jgi:hypothetical protein
MRRRAVVLAPNHADGDVRVNRATRAIAGLFTTTDVHWDPDYPGHRCQPTVPAASGRDVYALTRPRWRQLCLLGRDPFVTEVRERIRDADLVYVHASGAEGLLLAEASRRLNSSCRIVFDYHDSLAFEFAYQLRKKGVGWAYQAAWPVHRRMLRRWSRGLDALVGISDEQLGQFEQITGRRLPGLAVPNVREFGDPIVVPGATAGAGVIDLVWVGHVMMGRDLNRLVDWMMAAAPGAVLNLHGGVLDQGALDQVRARLGDRLRFHGPFAGDGALAARLGPRSVGVFLGWEDEDGTGINAIASPNKFFSYVNIGLPVIVHRRLTGLARQLERHGAGLAVGSDAEFARAVEALGAGYESFARGSQALRAEYAGRDHQQELREHIGRVL